MAIDIYLNKPHRACGSTRAIADMAKTISNYGSVLLVSQTNIGTNSLKYYNFNNNVYFANYSTLHTTRGCRYLAIFILDVGFPHLADSEIFHNDGFYFVRHQTEYIFYEILTDETKGYKINGNEIYHP